MSKAWKVEDPTEDRACVVHAATRTRAKRLGASELDYPESYILLRAVRAPEFDSLAGSDLLRAMLEGSWWWECAGCYERVSDGGEGWDEGRSTSGYVIRYGDVYCSSRCCLKLLRKERQRRIDTWDALRRATERWPGVEVQSLYQNTGGDWVVTLLRPGAEYPTTVLLNEEPERETA